MVVKNYDNVKENIDALTYTLDCKGAKGDMVYLEDTSGGHGYGVSEVKILTNGQ